MDRLYRALADLTRPAPALPPAPARLPPGARVRCRHFPPPYQADAPFLDGTVTAVTPTTYRVRLDAPVRCVTLAGAVVLTDEVDLPAAACTALWIPDGV